MVAAGVAVLCVGVYTVSRLSAQPAGQPPAQAPASPEPRTRIALLNLSEGLVQAIAKLIEFDCSGLHRICSAVWSGG